MAHASDIVDKQTIETASSGRNPEHEQLCLQVVLAMQMKVLHSILITSLYLLPSWQRQLTDAKSPSRAFYRRNVGINMLKRLRETQELGNWSDQEASAFIATYFSDTFGLSRKEFVITYSISLQKLIKSTLSRKVMTSSLKKQLMAMPASVLSELPEFAMDAVLPWTPVMQETMVATFDILPALTLKSCAKSERVSADMFIEKALYLGRQMLTPFMLAQHSSIYSSGNISVPFAGYQFKLKAQVDLLLKSADASSEALLQESVGALAGGFLPLVSDPRIMSGVGPLLQIPEFELLACSRLPLTIEITLQLLRIGLKAVGAEGKIFKPTIYGRSQTRDWSKVYVSLSGKVSARTVLDKTAWYLSTTLTLGAMVGQVVVTFAAPPVALVAVPWVAGTVVASQVNKTTRLVVSMASSISKWFGQEKLSPYSFKWDPSEPLMANEGHIRYYLSNWTDKNETPVTWIGANTGLAFFSLIAPFATARSLMATEPEGLAHLDALLYPPATRAEIIKKLTAMHKVVNNLTKQLTRQTKQHGDLLQPPATGAWDAAVAGYGVYSYVLKLNKMAEKIVNGKSVLWDQDSSSIQVAKYLVEAADGVDDAEDILPLLHGAIERLPDNDVTDLLEAASYSSDMTAALETLFHGLADEIAESFCDYTDYAVYLASCMADVAMQAWI